MQRKFLSRLTLALFSGVASLLAAPAIAAVTFQNWPTSTTVVTVDSTSAFTENLSGLFYQPAAGANAPILWAVQNSPAKLYSMAWNGTIYANTTGNNWGSGKKMVFTNGKGAPDAEGVTKAELNSSAIYVSIERKGSGKNRFSVLRYDTNASGTTLTATNEWDLTSNLPTIGATNVGLEGITWVPDSYLKSVGFKDENTNLAYDPANYANHGTGLFFVGLENNGTIYAYALNHSGSSFVRIATIASGQSKIMDLSFDRENGVLWAHCDDGCSNKATLLGVDTVVGSATKGKFIVKKGYNKPASLPNSNNEGIAIAPESECAGGVKPFFWSDDSDSGSHSIRKGTISCGPQF